MCISCHLTSNTSLTTLYIQHITPHNTKPAMQANITYIIITDLTVQGNITYSIITCLTMQGNVTYSSIKYNMSPHMHVMCRTFHPTQFATQANWHTTGQQSPSLMTCCLTPYKCQMCCGLPSTNPIPKC